MLKELCTPTRATAYHSDHARQMSSRRRPLRRFCPSMSPGTRTCCAGTCHDCCSSRSGLDHRRRSRARSSAWSMAVLGTCLCLLPARCCSCKHIAQLSVHFAAWRFNHRKQLFRHWCKLTCGINCMVQCESDCNLRAQRECTLAVCSARALAATWRITRAPLRHVPCKRLARHGIAWPRARRLLSGLRMPAPLASTSQGSRVGECGFVACHAARCAAATAINRAGLPWAGLVSGLTA